MSEVILNRIGVDHVNLNMITSGNSVATCSLDNLLLDPNLEYLIRVSELNAPISSLPIFGYNTNGTKINRELFRIKLRRPGLTLAQFQAPNTAAVPNISETNTNGVANGFSSSFKTTGRGGKVHYEPSGFLTDLGKSANNFSQQWDVIGAIPNGDPTGNIPNINDDPNIGAPGSHTDYLRIRLNADGCVEFIGTSIFWNNFVIQFSEYGKILFGIPKLFLEHNIMGVTTRVNDTLHYKIFDAGAVINLVTNANFKPAVETIRLVGATSIFKNLDHRYCVTVETDLLVTQAIRVVDGIQGIDRGICKVFFPTDCRVLLESENGVLREDVDFEIKTRVGQHSFVKKTNPSTQWTALQTSFDLRFFRFHLYVMYRYLNADNKWLFSRMKYPVPLDDYWSVTLEFVSKI